MVRALAAVAKEESASGVREFRVPDKDSLTALAESSSGDIRYFYRRQYACITGMAERINRIRSDKLTIKYMYFSERQSTRFNLPA